MITINAFNSSYTINRFLAKKYVAKNAPTLVLMAGIHGNELAAFFAIQKVLKQIKSQDLAFKGNFYALTGNLNAISKNKRFENVDLNRLWTTESIADLQHKEIGLTPEEKEQKELYGIIKDIYEKHTGEIYFVDLHTTSSPTSPFLTISDSINNRCFSVNFPLPVVLGIEEYIHGPLLTYINEFGHIGVGFEAGQHQDPEAVIINESFIWMVLVHTGCFTKEAIGNYDRHKKRLNRLIDFKGQFFEIDYKYGIQKGEEFQMQSGFKNFQRIAKGQELANSSINGKIRAPLTGRLFMPLYQKQGDDGFFIITRISKFWLTLSRYFRKMYLHHFLRILPGIKQSKINKYTLIVNPRTATFLTYKIFHFFGYRCKVKSNNKWLFSKRDREISPFS